MSGYPIIFGEGVDPDAYQYFLRAGIESGTQTPTAYDNAASFNGTNQFLSIPSNSSLQIGGQAFSFSIWFNASNAAVNNVFVSKVGAGPSLEYQMGTFGSNLRILIGNGSTGWIVNPVAGTFVTNTWNHAVFTYNGTNATIYLNGTSVGTGTGSITTSGTNQLQIGNNSPYGEKMAGALSSIGFWKKALTASEVTALFNSGAGRTYASLDSGLRNNLVSWWALNGTSSAVSLTDSHGGNNLTNNGSVTAPNIGPIITGYSDSRRLISDFVKGIKSLGLWNSMVCWPLRASQNAGGGTTAFSLGGLGQFNGTLVNAPTWTGTGISISPSTSRIDFGTVLQSLVLNDYHTYMNVFQKDASVTAGQIFNAYGTAVVGAQNRQQQLQITSSTNIRLTHNGYGGTANQTINANFNSTLGYYRTTQGGPVNYGFDAGLALNGGGYITDSVINSPTAMGDFNSIQTGTGLNIINSFMAVFPKTFISSFSPLYNIYKSTIGQGLGLP